MLCNELMRGLRCATEIPYDVHLMITAPEYKIKWFDLKAGDLVSVHYESTPHVQRALQEIKAAGARAAVALKPATPIEYLEYLLADIDMVLLMTVNPGFSGQKLIPQTVDKIARTRAFLDGRGYTGVSLQVDGNCSFENIPKMRAAGADCFVAGSSSIFSRDLTVTGAAERLRRIMK
jgi:ribulose-phosphate 3-epimerase